jgi:pimeloyl-ACP methyl ester carboxylesterase
VATAKQTKPSDLDLDDAPAKTCDVFLVDGNGLAYRAFHALPEELELVEDAGDHADEVPAPTLLVVGDHDQPDILRIAERLSHEIPGARLEHIADAAHVPSMERPQEFDRIVLGFLAEQL